ncbi:MAG: hypothetical protein U0470_03805 [Anaerolineae bacterium]
MVFTSDVPLVRPGVRVDPALDAFGRSPARTGASISTGRDRATRRPPAAACVSVRNPRRRSAHVRDRSFPGAVPARSDADRSALWGGLLIALGLLFLFRQLVPVNISDIVWGLALIGGGAFFLGAYRRDPASWALLIPGVALVVIGAGRLISSVSPRLGDAVGSGLLLGALGVAFLYAFYADRVEALVVASSRPGR